MGLSNDLISQFVKVTKNESKQPEETTVYGTAVKVGDTMYARLDGSDRVTPIEQTADVQEGDRVTIRIKNHTATITGNVSSPAARVGSVEEINGKVAIAVDSIEANTANIDNLIADNATIKDTLTATNANIETLTAENATITGKLTANEAEIETLKTEKLDVNTANITYATIQDLNAVDADFRTLESDYATLHTATVEDLAAKFAFIESLNNKYANIDFANINAADIEKLFSKSGIIEDLNIGDGVVSGKLVGVTISGDLIEGNTIKADKLVVKGSDGLYYKLNVTEGGIAPSETITEEDLQNGLHGSNIIAKTITAEKISVNDLIAFDATIGGFVIDENSIHSSVKTTVDNTTRGIYLDNDGQAAIGDDTNFIKYFKDTDDVYKLAITAGSVILGSSDGSGRDIEEIIDKAQSTADNNGTRIELAESAIVKLNEVIANLVTDENGASLMTQTTDGWTFSMASVQQDLRDVSAVLDEMKRDGADTETIIKALQQSVSDLGGYTEYIRILRLGDDVYYLVSRTANDDGSYSYTETSASFDADILASYESISIVEDAYTNTGKQVYQAFESGITSPDYFCIDSSNAEPCIELGENDSNFKVRVTNTRIMFMEGKNVKTYIDTYGLVTESERIEKELVISGNVRVIDEGNDEYYAKYGYVWKVRPNGNLGLSWKGAIN